MLVVPISVNSIPMFYVLDVSVCLPLRLSGASMPIPAINSGHGASQCRRPIETNSLRRLLILLSNTPVYSASGGACHMQSLLTYTMSCVQLSPTRHHLPLDVAELLDMAFQKKSELKVSLTVGYLYKHTVVRLLQVSRGDNLAPGRPVTADLPVPYLVNMRASAVSVHVAYEEPIRPATCGNVRPRLPASKRSHPSSSDPRHHPNGRLSL